MPGRSLCADATVIGTAFYVMEYVRADSQDPTLLN
jgi:aminoglycoside phosphotransferase (APT) family kinase protein